MKYACSECRRILTEDEAVTDPDGNIECESCYNKNKNNWFGEEGQKQQTPMKEKKHHWWEVE